MDSKWSRPRVNSRFKAFIVMQRKNISLYNEILSLLSAHRSRLICTNRLNVETVQTHTTTFIILFIITPNIFHKSNPRCKCSICQRNSRFSTFSYIHKITEWKCHLNFIIIIIPLYIQKWIFLNVINISFKMFYFFLEFQHFQQNR